MTKFSNEIGLKLIVFVTKNWEFHFYHFNAHIKGPFTSSDCD